MGTFIFHKCPRFSWVLFSNYSRIFLEPWFQNSNCLLFISFSHFCVHFYPLFHNIIIVLFNTKNTIFSIFISNIIKKRNLYAKTLHANSYVYICPNICTMFWNHGSKIHNFLIILIFTFVLYTIIYILILKSLLRVL